MVTPNAAMGVRGTDFHIKYDDWNKKTDLLVVHGRVAFIDIFSPSSNRELLKSLLNHKRAIEVNRGQHSSVNAKGELKEPGNFDPEVLNFVVIKDKKPTERKPTTEELLEAAELASVRGNLNAKALREKDLERTKALLKAMKNSF